MAKKLIPARTLVICDCCGNERGQSNGRLDAKVEIFRNGLDAYGHAVASNNASYDLCDTCMTAVGKAVQQVFDGSQKGESE